MKIYNKEKFNENKEKILTKIKEGAIFIYPTDTIYGIGCDARNFEAVKRIRELKNRDEKPFSVIAPSKEWIRKNCVINENAEKWLKKLPGPYTFILNVKNSVAKNVAPGLSTLGVRIPDHWFSELVAELGLPVVTTSANKAGGNFMTSIENLDDDIKPKVEFVIYEDEKHGSPSKIVDLTGEEIKVKER